MHVKAIYMVTFSLLIPGRLCAPIGDDRRPLLLARTVGQALKPASRILTSAVQNAKVAPAFSQSRSSSSYSGTDIHLHPDGTGGPDTSTTKKYTVGKKVAPEGKFGEVYDVKDPQQTGNRSPLVGKRFYPGTPSEFRDKALQNLRQVEQLRASGTDSKGHAWAVMDRAKGVPYEATPAFKATVTPGQPREGMYERSALRAHAEKLTMDAVIRNGKRYGVVNGKPTVENTRYQTSKNGRLVNANLVSWSKATPVSKDVGQSAHQPEQQQAVYLVRGPDEQ